MKTRLILIAMALLLCIGGVKGQKVIEIRDVIDSSYVWVRERASIERVREYLEPYNHSFSKSMFVIKVPFDSGIEERVVVHNEDENGRIKNISIVHRMKTTNSAKMTAAMEYLIYKALFSTKPFNVIQEEEQTLDQEMNYYGSSKKHKVLLNIRVKNYSSEWDALTTEIFLSYGTDFKTMRN